MFVTGGTEEYDDNLSCNCLDFLIGILSSGVNIKNKIANNFAITFCSKQFQLLHIHASNNVATKKEP
jgi:hypothetical protein